MNSNRLSVNRWGGFLFPNADLLNDYRLYKWEGIIPRTQNWNGCERNTRTGYWYRYDSVIIEHTTPLLRLDALALSLSFLKIFVLSTSNYHTMRLKILRLALKLTKVILPSLIHADLTRLTPIQKASLGARHFLSMRILEEQNTADLYLQSKNKWKDWSQFLS